MSVLTAIFGFFKPILEPILKELVNIFAFSEKKYIKETEDHATGPHIDVSAPAGDLLNDDLV